MKPGMILTGSLEKPIRTLDVSFNKRLRIDNRIVVVRFGSIMYDRIVPGYQLIKQIRITNVPNNELHFVLRKSSNIVRIGSISQLIHDGDAHIRHIVHYKAHKRRAAKTTTTRD